MAELFIQTELPLSFPHQERPKSIGQIPVRYIQSKTILNESQESSFLSEYDYTLNPYSGCTFSCTYCYAAFFTPDKTKQDGWGKCTCPSATPKVQPSQR